MNKKYNQAIRRKEAQPLRDKALKTLGILVALLCIGIAILLSAAFGG